MVSKHEKSVTYVSLINQFKKIGCPICSRLREIEYNEIYNILYGNVNDLYIRKKLRRSLGFCPYHSWLMVKIAEEEPIIGGLSPAIIYEDLLTIYMESLDMESLERRREYSSCIICKNIRDFEELYTNYIVESLSSTDILQKYSETPSIFCKRHYEMIIDRVNNYYKKKLREIQKEKIKRVLIEVRNYIKKHRYDVKFKPTESELIS